MGEDRILLKESATQELIGLLSDSGWQPGQRMNATQVQVRLADVSNKMWDAGRVKTFHDNQGSGWLIDISRGFGNLMLYAVVRPVDGQRAVVSVVDEADIRDIQEGAEADVKRSENPQVPIGDGRVEYIKELQDQLVALRKMVSDRDEVIRELQAELEKFKTVDPDGESLVSWWTSGDDPKVFYEKMKNNEIIARLQHFMMNGREKIEVWTQMRKPKISVEFE